MLSDKAAALLSPFPGSLRETTVLKGAQYTPQACVSQRPKSEEERITAKDPERASVKVNCPMSSRRFMVPCSEPPLAQGVENESKGSPIF